MILREWSGNYYAGVNESSITEVAPGRLLIVIATAWAGSSRPGPINNGESWTRPQPMSLAASTAPAQIRKLPTGHLLIVWNQEGEEGQAGSPSEPSVVRHQP